MCHRTGFTRKGFPRYDEIQHIDSTAVKPDDTKPESAPGSDPEATEYTEEYVKNGRGQHCKNKNI